MHLPNRLVSPLLALLLLCSISITAFAESPNSRQLYERIRPSVVEVVTQNRANLGVSSVASGFITYRKDWVITNYHAIADSIFEPDDNGLHIVSQDQGELKAEIVAVDIQNDLAILKVEQALRVPLLDLRETLPDRGESGYSMGKPGGYQHSIVTGTFNGVSDKTSTPLIIFSGAINGGMSGGPTLDGYGRVVGVNVATSTKYQLVGLAVPAEAVGQLIRRNTQQNIPSLDELRKDISRQVSAFNQQIVMRFDLPTHSVRRLGPFQVRGDISREQPCSAIRKDIPNDHYKRIDQRCDSSTSLYISDQQNAGHIVMGSFWFNSEKMSSHGLARLVEDQLTHLRNVKKSDGPTTSWNCTEQRLRGRFDLPIQLHACRRAVEKLPGLFDFRFRYIPLVPGPDALLVAVSMSGFDDQSARAILLKSMHSLSFTPKAKP
jgi:serine protease Do